MKEYLKDCGENLWDMIRFREIGFMIVLFFFCIGMFGLWLGSLIGLAIHFLTAHLEGGAVADILGEFPKEKFPPNTCSADIKDCQICNNEYTHEFNLEYDKGNRKWYK